MTQSNLKEVLARLIHDWKAKQKWNSYECGVQLETELAHIVDISALPWRQRRLEFRFPLLAYRVSVWLIDPRPK